MAAHTTPPHLPTTSHPPDHPHFVRALYPYTTSDAGSLSFRAGDLIQVLNQLDNGWWDGWLRGVRGWFPSNYCEDVDAKEIFRMDMERERGTGRDGLRGGDEEGTGESGEDGEDGEGWELGDLDGEDEGDYEVFLDEGYRDNDNEHGMDDGGGGGERDGRAEQEGDWIPQASADGEVYYFNTVTGSTRRGPLLEPGGTGVMRNGFADGRMRSGGDARFDSETTTLAESLVCFGMSKELRVVQLIVYSHDETLATCPMVSRLLPPWTPLLLPARILEVLPVSHSCNKLQLLDHPLSPPSSTAQAPHNHAACHNISSVAAPQLQ